jgi:hypothetical protein
MIYSIARFRLYGFGATDFVFPISRSEVWWRRRESNKRLYFQPDDLVKKISRIFSVDHVWIVSSIEFGILNFHDNIKPKTYGDRPSFESSFRFVAPPLIIS